MTHESPWMRRAAVIGSIVLAVAAVWTAVPLPLSAGGQTAGAQEPPPFPPPSMPGQFGRMGGPGMPREQKIVVQFDANRTGRLEVDERKTAREWLATNGGGRRGFGGRGGRGGFGGRGMATGSAGRALKPEDVRAYKTEPLYDPAVLRTLFLQFDSADWEQELAAFNNTDVEVPATVVVDSRTYTDVGVHFRGQSSFMMVPEGLKRSLNLSFDYVHDAQNVGGYRTLNLLNAASDPTFVRTLIYSDIARSYLPAPRVNYLRVVINGESWGIYLNAQQYNKDFLRDFFQTDAGARWKVPGSPGGRGGMEYLGEDLAPYRNIYEIKTSDDPKSWAALIRMFRVLNQTPAEKLEAALAPLLDIDGALKFLAIEMALVNTDGYWTRASDYSLYLDPQGQFHVIPHDMNEAMMTEGGRGGRGMRPGGPDQMPPPPGMGRGPFPAGRGFGPGGGGPELDPLLGLDDETKPLRSKLLAVPALRAKYLSYVRNVAERWLDWNTLGPLAAQYQSLIAEDVKADTRKLYPTEAFETALTGAAGLKTFVAARREYLLKVTSPK